MWPSRSRSWGTVRRATPAVAASSRQNDGPVTPHSPKPSAAAAGGAQTRSLRGKAGEIRTVVHTVPRAVAGSGSTTRYRLLRCVTMAIRRLLLPALVLAWAALVVLRHSWAGDMRLHE